MTYCTYSSIIYCTHVCATDYAHLTPAVCKCMCHLSLLCRLYIHVHVASVPGLHRTRAHKSFYGIFLIFNYLCAHVPGTKATLHVGRGPFSIICVCPVVVRECAYSPLHCVISLTNSLNDTVSFYLNVHMTQIPCTKLQSNCSS